MANLIITVIAIALVAVASMMGAYYGGKAYIASQQSAVADTMMNEGQQLAGAWNSYLAANGSIPPGNELSPLISQGYVSNWPQLPPINGAPGGNLIVIGANGHYYAIGIMGQVSGTAGVSDPNAVSCVRIGTLALGSSPTSWTNISAQQLVNGGANIGTGQFGCAMVNTTGTITIWTYNGVVPGYPNTTLYVAYYLLS